MKIALEELSLDRIIVLYPGNVNYLLTDKIEVQGLKNYLSKKDGG